MASIYKDRSTGRWVAQITSTHNGEKHTKRFTSKQRHIVEKKLQDYLNPSADDPNLTMLQLLTEVETPDYMLKHLDPLLLKHPDRVTVQEIEALLASNNQFRRDTLSRQLSTLTRAFKRGIATRRVTFDPTQAVRIPKGSPPKGRKVISHEDEAQILPQLSLKWQMYWTIGIETGLRPQEIRALHAEDLADGIVRVHRVLKTQRAKRNLRASERLQDALKANLWIDSGPLFPNNQSAPRQAFTRACKKAGTDAYVPYELRHTFLTRAANRGVPLLKLTQIAGHSTTRMITEYYAHAPDVIDID